MSTRPSTAGLDRQQKLQLLRSTRPTSSAATLPASPGRSSRPSASSSRLLAALKASASLQVQPSLTIHEPSAEVTAAAVAQQEADDAWLTELIIGRAGVVEAPLLHTFPLGFDESHATAERPDSVLLKSAILQDSSTTDVSFLTDKPGHGRQVRGEHIKDRAHCPPSIIPHAYHKYEKRFHPPDQDDPVDWEYHASVKAWVRRTFPALNPSGRRDAVHLSHWLDTMLQQLDTSGTPIQIVQQAQVIYSSCFHELARQVSVHCVERGELLLRVWRVYLNLFNRLIEMSNTQTKTMAKLLEQGKMETKQQIADQEARHQAQLAEMQLQLEQALATATAHTEQTQNLLMDVEQQRLTISKLRGLIRDTLANSAGGAKTSGGGGGGFNPLASPGFGPSSLMWAAVGVTTEDMDAIPLTRLRFEIDGQVVEVPAEEILRADIRASNWLNDFFQFDPEATQDVDDDHISVLSDGDDANTGTPAKQAPARTADRPGPLVFGAGRARAIPNDDTNAFNLPHRVTGPAAMLVFQFIMSGELPQLSIDTAEAVLRAAEALDVPALIVQLTEQLQVMRQMQLAQSSSSERELQLAAQVDDLKEKISKLRATASSYNVLAVQEDMGSDVAKLQAQLTRAAGVIATLKEMRRELLAERVTLNADHGALRARHDLLHIQLQAALQRNDELNRGIMGEEDTELKLGRALLRIEELETRVVDLEQERLHAEDRAAAMAAAAAAAREDAAMDEDFPVDTAHSEPEDGTEESREVSDIEVRPAVQPVDDVTATPPTVESSQSLASLESKRADSSSSAKSAVVSPSPSRPSRSKRQQLPKARKPLRTRTGTNSDLKTIETDKDLDDAVRPAGESMSSFSSSHAMSGRKKRTVNPTPRSARSRVSSISEDEEEEEDVKTVDMPDVEDGPAAGSSEDFQFLDKELFAHARDPRSFRFIAAHSARLKSSLGSMHGAVMVPPIEIAKPKSLKIPSSMAKLFAGPAPRVTAAGRSLPLAVLQRTIQQVYKDKIESDRTDAAASKTAFVEYVYDWMLNKYGLRRIVEQQLVKLLNGLCKHLGAHLGCYNFARFIGLDGLGPEALEVYLDWFSQLAMPSGNSTAGESQKHIIKEDTIKMITLTRAVALAQATLGECMGTRTVEYRRLLARIESQCIPHGAGRSIEQDLLLTLLLEEWKDMNTRARETLGALFVAGDVNADGVLSLDEFAAILHHVNHNLTDHQISAMYRQSLSGVSALGDVMTKEDFVEVGLKYGLLTYRAGSHRLSMTVSDAEAQFALLQNTWEEDEARVISVASKAGPLVEERVELLRQLLSARADINAAWMCYRMIMHVVQRHLDLAQLLPSMASTKIITSQLMRRVRDGSVTSPHSVTASEGPALQAVEVPEIDAETADLVGEYTAVTSPTPSVGPTSPTKQPADAEEETNAAGAPHSSLQPTASLSDLLVTSVPVSQKAHEGTARMLNDLMGNRPRQLRGVMRASYRRLENISEDEAAFLLPNQPREVVTAEYEPTIEESTESDAATATAAAAPQTSSET